MIILIAVISLGIKIRKIFRRKLRLVRISKIGSILRKLWIYSKMSKMPVPKNY